MNRENSLILRLWMPFILLFLVNWRPPKVIL